MSLIITIKLYRKNQHIENKNFRELTLENQLSNKLLDL